MMNYEPCVYVVLLNWNGWQDTVACLESVFASDDVNFKVVGCDNASSDGSLSYIEQWAQGHLATKVEGHPRLYPLRRASQASVGFQSIRLEELGDGASLTGIVPPLTLLDNQANIGFAAGNNTGIDYAMSQPEMTHIWLLNNDTLVEPDCLKNMLDRLDESTVPAICGSRIMFYDAPEVVQAMGGNSYNRWRGDSSMSLGRGLLQGELKETAWYESKLDYLCGASILLPRTFVDAVGLMEESYFLYYEELDWMLRAKGRYRQLIADAAVVYHREGSSIGSASWQRGPSLLSEFYKFRNKLAFTRKFFPYALLTSYLFSWLQVANRIRKGYWRNAWLISQVLLGRREYPG